MGAAILEEVLCPYKTVDLRELNVEPAGGSAFGRQARFEGVRWYEACRYHKVSRNNGRCEPFFQVYPNHGLCLAQVQNMLYPRQLPNRILTVFISVHFMNRILVYVLFIWRLLHNRYFEVSSSFLFVVSIPLYGS